jgi:periplasmic protein TonB
MSPFPPDFRFALVDTSTRYSSAQPLSVLFHVAIFASLLFLFASGRNPSPFDGQHPIRDFGHSIVNYSPPPELREGMASLGLRGGGGANEPLPAKRGELVPLSRMPLARPRLTHNEPIDLPAPPAVFDPNAPSNVRLVANPGLPWGKRDTNSAGPEGGDTIGNGGRDGMGDNGEGGSGVGDTPGSYANVVSYPACVYCPEPPYSDEARKAKLQGLVTLRVLIGSDGRAKRIQFVKGLGMGLDESALAAIHNWRFAPARDARRQPMASWVTIETRFQLF